MTPYAWAGGGDSRLSVMNLSLVTAHFVISEHVKDAA